MTFDEWVTEYYGENVDFPEAVRAAWDAATRAEREACASLCRENGYEVGAALANEILARSKSD
jgi:hypothetical protein